MNNIDDINTLSKSLSYLKKADINLYQINKDISAINKMIPESIDSKLYDLDIDTNDIEKSIDKEKQKELLKYICTNKYDLVSLLNCKTITMYDLIEISESYLKLMLRKDSNYIPYWLNLKTISNPYEELYNLGISYDIIKEINSSFLTYLINKKMMYSIDGIRYAYIFIGFLAIFGFRISSKANTESTYYIGKENNRLSGIDNLFEYITKSIGIDSTGIDNAKKYRLSGYELDKSYYVDGYISGTTPISEINVGIERSYFINGKCGDILLNNSILKLILDNDGTGYYVAEVNKKNACIVISYYKYEELVDYKISNMVSFYENVTKNSRTSSARSSNFISPYEFISNIEINDLYKDELINIYNKMNKNPNAFNNPLIDEKEIINKVGDLTTINFDENYNTIKIVPLIDKNILPDNKFSAFLPKLAYGNVNYMEINNNSVNYEIINISNDIYNTYINLLKSSGYKYSSEGTWLNDDYKVVTELSEDKTKMVLSLFTKK